MIGTYPFQATTRPVRVVNVDGVRTLGDTIIEPATFQDVLPIQYIVAQNVSRFTHANLTRGREQLCVFQSGTVRPQEPNQVPRLPSTLDLSSRQVIRVCAIDVLNASCVNSPLPGSWFAIEIQEFAFQSPFAASRRLLNNAFEQSFSRVQDFVFPHPVCYLFVIHIANGQEQCNRHHPAVFSPAEFKWRSRFNGDVTIA